MINITSGNFYIGSSKNVSKRIGRHKYVLKNNIYDNSRIKEDAIKYGIDSFIFEVLEYCDDSERLQKEQHYYEKLNPYYNVWPSVYSAKNRNYTPEQLQRLKELHKPIKDIELFKEKLKLAWIKRKKDPNFKEIMARSSRLGSKHSDETKNLFSIQRKGKPKSEAMKDKLRKFRIGTKWDPINKIWIKN